MKTKYFFYAALCIVLYACNTNVSKEENPRGLYRLQDFTYEESGKTIEYPFNQYYYLTDNGMLLINVDQDNLPHATGSVLCFSMSDNEWGIRPLDYTGKASEETETKSAEVYDSNSKEFTLRWYNERGDLMLNYFFPYKSYITEHYSATKNVSRNLKRAMEILSNPVDSKGNKLYGVWHRKDSWFNLDGENVHSNEEIFRIHTEKEVLILFNVYEYDGHVYAACQLRPCKYTGETATKEGNIDCGVEWENDDCFKLNILNGKYEQYEVWERSGLPEGFQKIFGTNVPINITHVELPPPPEAPAVAEILDVEEVEEVVEEE